MDKESAQGRARKECPASRSGTCKGPGAGVDLVAEGI
jgi:hypothetical protein